MVRFSEDNPTGFRISGMDAAIPAALWKMQLTLMLIGIQKKIADGYKVGRVAGSRWLIPAKSPSYIRWKLRTVGHNRRGHLFEGIQTTLDSTRLWTLAPLTGKNLLSSRANFSESILREYVGYAKYYEAQKVPGGRILLLAASWIAEAQTVMREWEAVELAKIAERQASKPTRGAGNFKGRPSPTEQRIRDIAARIPRYKG